MGKAAWRWGCDQPSARWRGDDAGGGGMDYGDGGDGTHRGVHCDALGYAQPITDNGQAAIGAEDGDGAGESDLDSAG